MKKNNKALPFGKNGRVFASFALSMASAEGENLLCLRRPSFFPTAERKMGKKRRKEPMVP